MYSFRDTKKSGNGEDMTKDYIQEMINNVFKVCWLCCSKIKNEDLEMIALCKEFYKKNKRVPYP